ncbi:MAG: DUF2147 domain-containing protein [Paludibacter sp.]|nr:DUF2147 domain-containing protein [Paludibacter sp.]
MKKLISILFLCATTIFANAQVEKMLGYWISVDDNTGKEESVFYVYKGTDGNYYGKLVKLIDPKREGAVCDKCTGTDYNKPLEGLILMKSLKADGNNLTGGTITDPKNGKVYYVKVSLDTKTDRLKIRGSLDKIGILGRTQYWIRKK